MFLKQKRGKLLAPGNINCAIVGIPVNVFSTIRAMMLVCVCTFTKRERE